MLVKALSDSVCHHCSWQKPPSPQSQGAARNVSQESALRCFPRLLRWWGRYQGSTAQKELLSLFLPLLTPTHSDGLFVVTSAASGGPWEG